MSRTSMLDTISTMSSSLSTSRSAPSLGNTLLATGTYLVFYIRRRIRIGAPTPWPSLFVMIGYAIWLAVLAIALTGVFWQPSLSIITSLCLWALCSGGVIFVTFLRSFVDSERAA